jgi:hypothetical protein
MVGADFRIGVLSHGWNTEETRTGDRIKAGASNKKAAIVKDRRSLAASIEPLSIRDW